MILLLAWLGHCCLRDQPCQHLDDGLLLFLVQPFPRAAAVGVGSSRMLRLSCMLALLSATLVRLLARCGKPTQQSIDDGARVQQI